MTGPGGWVAKVSAATVGVADRAATVDAQLGDAVLAGGTEAAGLDSAPLQAARRKIAPSAA
jgi:hypothetical protein